MSAPGGPDERTAARLAARRAVEALRSGVPNRDAVVALGCNQPEIEARFRRQLEALRRGGPAPGTLVQGGFGAGKSHLFEYLQHVALEEGFVVSKVVVSKEAPLYDPTRLYRAAVESAVVPGRRGAMLAEVAAGLDLRGEGYARLVEWVNGPEAGLNARFPALLFLFGRLQNDPEIADWVVRFWAGEPVTVGEVRRYLRALREPVTYRIDSVPAKELAMQRFAFTARLIQAAGYAGWVLLVDEVELIARYSLLQRARSYAEVARWLGRVPEARLAGLTGVLAVTDDFRSEMLDEKDDWNRAPGRLAARGTDVDARAAEWARVGLQALRAEGINLRAPDAATVEETYSMVRALHGKAYGWEPPPVRSAERLASTRMRQYVKGWITEWDLRRLDPGYQVQLEATEVGPGYGEDVELEGIGD